MQRKRLGEVLIEAGILRAEELPELLEMHKKAKKRLGEFLVLAGRTTEEEICKALSSQMKIPLLKLADMKIDSALIQKFPPKLCFNRSLIPVSLKGNRVLLAMSDPLDFKAMDEVSFATGLRVEVAVARTQDILDALMRAYPEEQEAEAIAIDESDNVDNLVQVLQDTDDLDDLNEQKLQDSAKGHIIIRLTNAILTKAVGIGASDIHIEPQENDVAVRCRVDGILHDITSFGKNAQAPVISRIKIMSNLDITVRRAAQDGRIRIKVGNIPYDLRVSTIPAFYGEKVVMRILDTQKSWKLDTLGLPDDELARFRSMLERPQGLVLVTGPTGSGKTTTLYAALRHLYSKEVNICTIEDPIEYTLAGVNQVNVNPKAGVTFANGLRTLLRQDPDIILVGEIRDKETATIAFQAAQTGHMVLSTLHTNDAVSAISRLMDMGVEPFVIASSLVGVMAQRLVRRIHEPCRVETQPSDHIRSIFPHLLPDRISEGKGCPDCQNSGYAGRQGIYELMTCTGNLLELIKQRASSTEILMEARRSGMRSMTEFGLDLAIRGLTTVDEVMRTAPPALTSPVGPMAAESKPPDVVSTQYLSDARVPAPPRQQKTNQAAGESSLDAFLRETDKRGTGGRRILCVDDDPNILALLKAFLESESFDVVQALGPKIGLEKLLRETPDLIIVDHNMPEMNGMEFIKRLKSHPRTRSIPIVMLTGNERESLEVEALEAGVDDWIPKPIQKPKLLARVNRIFRKIDEKGAGV